jgi:TetR/AcrR family fatty acid metabolism transcriptional regulator
METEKKPTSRKLQADKTRKEIYRVSIALMDNKGFGNTTIEEISREAGVSVGTFYHYFKSKEDIFFDLYKKADEYFETTVAQKLQASGLPGTEQIILYFKYYARYNKKRGFGNITQLYNTKNKFFTVKGRYMQELLKEVIQDGQDRKEISSDMSPEEATEFLFIASRGVVYDWCIHEGTYDLEKKMEAYMKKLVRIFALR